MITFTLPSGHSVLLIGDPHLGRKFEVGVPPHRKGEREKSQLAQFVTELNVEANIVVVIGDLFDNPYVGFGVIDAAHKALVEAVEANPYTTYVVLAGNHDMPRNITNLGAFDDLKSRLDGRYKNLHLLTKPALIEGLALFPWEWNRRADEQVSDITGHVLAAVGHWDLSTFNGKDTHLAPVGAIHAAYGDVPCYSGHYHTPGNYPVGSATVVCTGSLQPYTHGEDPNNTLYVTLSRSEALDRDPVSLQAFNVRIRRKRGEDMPDIDCLSLTYIYEDEVDEGATPGAEKVVNKDWSKILSAKLAPLDPRVQTFIKDRINVDTQE